MKEKDDNDWTTYTEEYMKDIILTYRDCNNSFFVKDGWEKLHPNFKAIYSVAKELNPASILECGCGGGYHLKNLFELLFNCSIWGFDVTEKQVDFGKWFSQLPPEVENNLFVMDLTGIVIENQFEFVFTNAVIMHLSTENARKALLNMKKLSSKYIFMVENPNHHGGKESWRAMLAEIFADCKIEYPSLYVEDAVLITKQ
jgi:SAM-dependent methyltransferase